MDLRQIASVVAPTPASFRLRQATVVSVDYAYPLSTCSIFFAGDTSTTLSNISYMSHVFPRPGDSVFVLVDGADMLIVGTKAPVSPPVLKVRRTTDQLITSGADTVVAFSDAPLIDVAFYQEDRWRMFGTRATGGVSYVRNATFDSTNSGNTDGWSGTWLTNPVATLAYSTAQAKNGAGSMLVTWPATVSSINAVAWTALFGLTPGRTYTVSAWVYVPATMPTVNLSVFFVSTVATSTTTGAWQQLTVTFTATAATHYINIYPTGTVTAGQTCYVDSVQCDLGTTAGSFDTYNRDRIRLPLVGWYEASAAVRFDGNATGTYRRAAILTSTQTLGLTQIPPAGAAATQFNVSTGAFAADANDYVYLNVTHDASVSLNIRNSQSSNWLSVRYLGPAL